MIKIALEELKNIFGDSGARLVMVIGILMYGLFYAIPYSNEVLRDIPISVADLDNSTLSRQYIRMVEASENVKIENRALNLEEAKEQYKSAKVKSFIVIPKDFERDLKRSKKVHIALYADSGYLLIYKQVANASISAASTLSAQIEINSYLKKGMSKQQASSVVLPFELINIPLFNPSGGYESYIYPAVLVLILQQTLLVGIGIVGGTLRERKKPLSQLSKNPSIIILGKTLAHLTLYLIHSIIYFLIIPHFYSYRAEYNLPLLFLLLTPFLISVSFLGQSLLYFFKKRESSLMTYVVTSLPMIFLPGFVWPKEAIPLWLNTISLFIPATSAIDALLKVNQMGAGFDTVKYDFLILCFLCFLYFISAYYSTKTIIKEKSEIGSGRA